MNREVENTNEKKKQIRLAIIGVVALLLLTLGTTFAYFLIDTDNSTSKSNIKGDISKAGLATLVPGTGNLHINLNAEDMAEANQGTEYYGDELEENPYVLSEEEGTHTISQVQITDGEETTKYSCTAKVVVTMEIAEDNNMGSVLQPGDLILQFKGNLINEKLDLSEISEVGTKEYDLNFKLTGNTTEDIEAYIKLINREDNQNYLASRNLKVDINTTELSCDIFIPNTKLIAELREKTSCLTDELVNGLYRCQGNSIVNSLDMDQETIETTQTVNNNYICLGSDCSTAEGNDMYRIIGVTEDGEMKVIKNTPANNSIAWNNDYQTDIKWPESELYKYLNDDFYKTLPIELKEKIVNATWLYGDVNPDNMSSEDQQKMSEYEQTMMGGGDENTKKEAAKNYAKLTADFVVTEEAKAADKTTGNISLMSITDYCSSFESDKELNCMSSTIALMTMEEEIDLSTLGLTWMTPSSDIMTEWTMSRDGFSGTICSAWGVDADGFAADGGVVNVEIAARPVFFLTSDIELSGEGTIASPFRVAGIE